MDAAIAELLRMGLPGAVIVVLGIAYSRLQARFDAVQNQRVADAKEIRDQVRELVAALTNSTSATEASREAIVEMKDAFKGLAEEVRSRRPR